MLSSADTQRRIGSPGLRPGHSVNLTKFSVNAAFSVDAAVVCAHADRRDGGDEQLSRAPRSARVRRAVARRSPVISPDRNRPPQADAHRPPGLLDRVGQVLVGARVRVPLVEQIPDRASQRQRSW